MAQMGFFVQGRIGGYPVWFDNGRIKLPYHGGDDDQELFYKLDGREWWDNERRLIEPYVKAGDVAVDVGANLGFMSGVLSSLTGSEGHVHSFEPNPKIFARLLEVVEANHYGTISAYNMGCGKQEDSMTLHCPASSGQASLRPGAGIERSSREKKNVRIVKLDEFLGPKLERLDFLKIDTEGFEDQVIFGASGLICRFHPVIYIELCSEYLDSSERAIRLLLDYGYRFEHEVDLRHSTNGANFIALPIVH